MKILIIGAKGMLGQELVRAFSDQEAVAWDREEIDISEEQNVKQKVEDERPDIVINSAAYNDVDGAENSTDLANQINGRAVGYLANACQRLAIPLVHYSTDYVFEGANKEGYDENARPNPINAYGRSKYLGEEELRKKTDKFYLIRLSRLFGHSGAGKKSFPELMIALSEKRDEIEVVDEEVACPTYAWDLARLTRQIIDKQLPYGVYHGANSGHCTWYEFAEETFKINGKNVRLIPVPGARFPRPAPRPRYSALLNTKLPPQRDWQSALKEFFLK